MGKAKEDNSGEQAYQDIRGTIGRGTSCGPQDGWVWDLIEPPSEPPEKFRSQISCILRNLQAQQV